jgi:CDP-diacylglycerol---glycerol-3-phosphate 3-phosphatidyltransferase
MANLITIARFPLLILVILLLYTPSPTARLVNVGLMVLLIAMDSLDGMVARARKEVSLLGSVLDIMADRSVEQVMWVVYAHLGLVSVAVPIIFILRGIVVDALRAVDVGAGHTPFGATQSRVGAWIVGSPWMRSTYGVVKLLAFAGLALTHALMAYAERGAVATGTADTVWLVFRVVSWVAVGFCLTRGMPVILESFARLRAKGAASGAQRKA